LRLFEVVDRIVEAFMQGQLPVGTDAGGETLERYYWDRVATWCGTPSAG
jgi:hypothetical protein